MSCLRCGKETTNEQVFCDSCLAVMREHPVKPGAPVYIPRRSEPAPRKQTRRRRELSAEEQLGFFQKLTRWLAAVIAALLVAVTILGVMLYNTLNPKEEEPPKGRNYTYVGDSLNR